MRSVLRRLLQAFSSRVYIRGIPHLLWLLRSHLAERGAVYTLASGVKMKLSASDYFQWMMLWNYYSPGLVSFLRRNLKQGDVFIDVGAQIGYFSMQGAQLVGNTGLVIAVEPDPRAAEVLRENARLNGVDQVHVLPVAASHDRERLTFNLATQLGWSTAVPLAPTMVTERRIQVDSRTLDDLLAAELPVDRRIALVKIDVEGFEAQVLTGAESLLSRKESTFLVEVNPDALKASGRTVLDVLSPFIRHGYRLFWLGELPRVIGRTGSLHFNELMVADLSDLNRRAGDVIAVPAV